MWHESVTLSTPALGHVQLGQDYRQEPPSKLGSTPCVTAATGTQEQSDVDGWFVLLPLIPVRRSQLFALGPLPNEILQDVDLHLGHTSVG